VLVWQSIVTTPDEDRDAQAKFAPSYAGREVRRKRGQRRAPLSPACVIMRIKKDEIAQALYAFGALLCIINTYVSITVIVLIQLNYAIAPQIRLLNRLG
jgi:hypothetical protein